VKRTGLLAIALIGALALLGCRGSSVHIRTKTERTERVIESKIVDPGDAASPQVQKAR